MPVVLSVARCTPATARALLPRTLLVRRARIPSRIPCLRHEATPLSPRHLVHPHRKRVRYRHPVHRTLGVMAPLLPRRCAHLVAPRRHHNQLGTRLAVAKLRAARPLACRMRAPAVLCLQLRSAIAVRQRDHGSFFSRLPRCGLPSGRRLVHVSCVPRPLARIEIRAGGPHRNERRQQKRRPNRCPNHFSSPRRRVESRHRSARPNRRNGGNE